MPLTGRKRGAEAELQRDGDAAAAGGAAGGAAAAALAAPYADVKPALQPSDVHVLLADDEKISRLVTAKLLRTCVPRARNAASRGQRSPGSPLGLRPRLPPRLTRARAPRPAPSRPPPRAPAAATRSPRWRAGARRCWR
jgi:hypothetical protein